MEAKLSPEEPPPAGVTTGPSTPVQLIAYILGDWGTTLRAAFLVVVVVVVAITTSYALDLVLDHGEAALVVENGIVKWVLPAAIDTTIVIGVAEAVRRRRRRATSRSSTEDRYETNSKIL